MSANHNRVVLLGNLTRDIELRHTATNNAVAQIGIAVSRTYEREAGQRVEETTYVECEAWGRTAETAARYLRKGSAVFIEGRLRLDQWEDRTGQKRSRLVVVAEKLQFLDRREAAEQAPPQRQAPARRQAPPQQSGGYEPITEEDIPF